MTTVHRAAYSYQKNGRTIHVKATTYQRKSGRKKDPEPTNRKLAIQQQWPTYDPDPSWKHKAFSEMSRKEWDAYAKESGRQSAELTHAAEDVKVSFWNLWRVRKTPNNANEYASFTTSLKRLWNVIRQKT